MSEPETQPYSLLPGIPPEARLRETEELFRGIFDHARTGIVMTDLADRFLRCNPAYERMLSVHANALRGKSVNDFVHPDDRAKNESLLMQLTSGAIDFFESVSRYVKPSGDVLWVHKYVSLTKVADGAPQGILKLITDITEIKRQELALAASEDRFRTLAAALPAMIFVADAQGSNAYTNLLFQTYTGLGEEKLLGSGWLDVIHPDDRERAAAVWEQSWRTGEPYAAEYRFRRADGAWRSFYCRGQPMRDQSGAIVQWVGTCTEIQQMVEARDELAESRALLQTANEDLEKRVFARTLELREANVALELEIQRREAAQAALVQSQKLEALGQLTSGIAHDFNNILAVIGGGCELIAKRIDDPVVADIASQCRETVRRGAKLVKQMLAFARQEVLAPRPVDLAELAVELAPLIRQATPGTAVTLDFGQDLPAVMIDPLLLETSLLNLAVNARDAMPDGGELSIRAMACPVGTAGRPGALGASDAVAIEVRDTGVGIPPEVLQRVAEPFFTTKPRGKGTGLGLAMVHGFVAQSGGEMRIATEVGAGTTVTLYLPCADAEAPPHPGPRVEQEALAGDARLLLVDDDDAVRTVTAAQLRDLGYQVSEARGFDEALAAIDREAQLDCVISDVIMPGGDGIELAGAAAARRPGLPFLFMTGHADNKRVAGERLIAKPFTAAGLTQAIAAAIAAG